MTTKPQSIDPERLGDEEGSRGNARISLRMGNGLAFTGGLGLVETEAGCGERCEKEGRYRWYWGHLEADVET